MKRLSDLIFSPWWDLENETAKPFLELYCDVCGAASDQMELDTESGKYWALKCNGHAGFVEVGTVEQYAASGRVVPYLAYPDVQRPNPDSCKTCGGSGITLHPLWTMHWEPIESGLMDCPDCTPKPEYALAPNWRSWTDEELEAIWDSQEQDR